MQLCPVPEPRQGVTGEELTVFIIAELYSALGKCNSDKLGLLEWLEENRKNQNPQEMQN